MQNALTKIIDIFGITEQNLHETGLSIGQDNIL